MVTNNKDVKFNWSIFLYEMICTALLLVIGLSFVTIMFGAGSPVEKLIPDLGIRRIITGFLFGSTGALIAISPLGTVSGAHVNPVVSMVFWLFQKIDKKTAASYILGQFTGALIGCLPLLAWGEMGRSVEFGATTPGHGYSLYTVLLGEVATTFTMVSLLILFLAFRKLRPYTPAIFPFLYSIMSYLEAAISGVSTNPARSLGPSVISGQWSGWWIYWIGPVAGALLAALSMSFFAKRITEARLYHFDNESDRLFRNKIIQ
ncbi:MAG TPA: aquaporin [Puia sp.]|nr:aquaporin [Puia sp.]